MTVLKHTPVCPGAGPVMYFHEYKRQYQCDSTALFKKKRFFLTGFLYCKYHLFIIAQMFNNNICPRHDTMVSGTLNTSGSTNIKELASSLYKSHYQLLMRYGKQVSQNEELVKDAIQDLFLTLCGQEGVLRGIHNPQTYLCRSLRRIMLRQLRKEKNMYERDGLWAAESNLYDESDHAMADEVLLKSNKYATRAWATAGLPSISRNRLRKVEQAMGSLTARQVETVFLKYYEGLANEEIAGVLDIASQSVCNLLSEALSRLRKQISQHYDAKRYTSIVPVRVRQTG